MKVHGAFMRYSIDKHRSALEEWPGMGHLMPIVFKKTYEEASDAAALSVVRSLIDARPEGPIRWVFHPHKEDTTDPMEVVGGHGWKLVE
jgi:hypothetical protein